MMMRMLAEGANYGALTRRDFATLVSHGWRQLGTNTTGRKQGCGRTTVDDTRENPKVGVRQRGLVIRVTLDMCNVSTRKLSITNKPHRWSCDTLDGTATDMRPSVFPHRNVFDLLLSPHSLHAC